MQYLCTTGVTQEQLQLCQERLAGQSYDSLISTANLLSMMKSRHLLFQHDLRDRF
jgi:hypothetical protein